MGLKRLLLIAGFIVYQLVIPFVFVNCAGEDKAYDRSLVSSDSSSDDGSTSDDCDTNEFLTADCVDSATATTQALQEGEDNPEAYNVDDPSGDDANSTDDSTTEE